MKQSIERTQLENGLIILTEEVPYLCTVTIGIFTRKGSRHEPISLNGVSHFIEHLVFRGSKNRSAKQIASELDQLGGNFDAFATQESLGFIIKTAKDSWKDAIELFADILMNPMFEPEAIELEKCVIVEEMKMVKDNPEELINELFHSAIFPNHPLGLPIEGTKKTVKSFSEKLLKSYHKNLFHPSNLIITAVGKINHDSFAKHASKLFKGYNLYLENFRETKPNMAFPIIIERRKSLKQAQMILGFPWVNATSQNRYAAYILENILGNNSSSRFWQRIREEKGLAYSIGLNAASFKDCGYLGLSVATDSSNLREVVKLATEEIRSIKTIGITRQELEVAKKQAEISILINLEDTYARTSNIAQSEMIFRRQISIEEILNGIKSVTKAQVQEIANKFFQADKATLVVLGNLSKSEINRRDLSV